MWMENQIIQGDCTKALPQLPRESIDLVVTDPPYGVRYADRNGRTVANDDDLGPVLAAFDDLYRVLKQNTFCISFYGWNRVDEFFKAWRSAGFYPVGHLVWRKSYASSRGFLEARHEQAYLLAKGRPAKPAEPIADVREWEYSGNRVHPTQKAVSILAPLIEAFSRPGDLVLDPFSGSGSTLVAAAQVGRRFLGIELEPHYCEYARECLGHHASRRRGHNRFEDALAGFGSWMEQQGHALPADFYSRASREWHRA
ncbi:MAG: DNA methyltransferase [Steroidobacteraceae bacterium]